MDQQKIVFIVGPTAVGKSKIAFELAGKINGEIVSCDSMQIYKEVRIASNKPTDEERSQVPHHLVDMASVNEDFDVVRFNRAAVESIRDIHARQKCPIVAGGSGMYVKILLDGIFQGGGPNEELRQELRREAETEGNDFVYQKLVKMDADAAEKIHPNDIKRVIRAVEVCLTQQKPISELQKDRKGLWGNYNIFVFGINRDRDQLYRIIEDRVEAMVEKGIVEEVKRLEGYALSQTARSIIGVKEIKGYLNGEYDLDHAKYLMKLNTRRLAKRQLTWFRKEDRIRWFNITEGRSYPQIVENIKELIDKNEH